MAVLQIQTGARCKLCQHHRRIDIDALLEARSRRRSDDDGNKINLAYVLAKFAEWGVENPTAENVTVHVKKHLEFVDDQVQQTAEKVAQERARELLARAGDVNVEDKLKWLIEVGIAEVEERIARGEKSGVTLDHVMKAAAELQRRSHNESQHALLGALVGGIGQALLPAKERAALNEPIIDAEYEDVT